MINFAQQWIKEFDADPVTDNFVRQVQASFSYVSPTLVSSPQMQCVSDSACQLIGLDEKNLWDESATQWLAGNEVEQIKTYATCYGGHQFGHWASQLGDGRAIFLGDFFSDIDGEKKLWELQLKGAGPTPYSRSGDGRAVLRSSIREYVCSEAMAALGVPTTRALSLLTTGEQVLRDPLYDGNPLYEQGAIVARLSPSFVRFGHFELLAQRQQLDELKQLADYVIKHHFPAIDNKYAESDEHQKYIDWFQGVAEKTLVMIIDWLALGFVHGVMNTDNMSVLGLTIDYGPFGWLDSLQPGFTPNTSDHHARYAYGEQASIALWNLHRFGHAISPLLGEHADYQMILKTHFFEAYQRQFNQRFAKKIGFENIEFTDSVSDGDSDQLKALNHLVVEMFSMLQRVPLDWTLFFRRLSRVNIGSSSQQSLQMFDDAWTNKNHHAVNKKQQDKEALLSEWLVLYQQALTMFAIDDQHRTQQMNRENPVIIPRNYLLQNAIDDAKRGDYSCLKQLMKALEQPYLEQKQFESFYLVTPSDAECQSLSCSS